MFLLVVLEQTRSFWYYDTELKFSSIQYKPCYHESKMNIEGWNSVVLVNV